MMNKRLLNSKLADRTYLVGGAVRDHFIGIPVEDLDYVIEATEKEFREAFPTAPKVGNEFPIFLVDGDEVALTRTERSTGKGYGDFEVDGVGVSIEDDLRRRDFTINAIAMRITDRMVFDPFNGLKDIEDERIRLVFDKAFEEDPVRIIRAARLAAKLNFNIKSKTLMSMETHASKLEFMTKERIAAEIEKMYKQADHPSHFFRFLQMAGALKFIFPSLAALDDVPAGPVEHHGFNTAFDHTMEVIDKIKAGGGTFTSFMAGLFHDLGKGVTPKDVLPHHYGHEVESERLAIEELSKHRFSARVNEFVPKAARLHMRVHLLTQMSPKKLVKYAREIGLRDWAEMFDVFRADSRNGLSLKEEIIADKMRVVISTSMSKEEAEIIKKSKKPADTAHSIFVSRMKMMMMVK